MLLVHRRLLLLLLLLSHVTHQALPLLRVHGWATGSPLVVPWGKLRATALLDLLELLLDLRGQLRLGATLLHPGQHPLLLRVQHSPADDSLGLRGHALGAHVGHGHLYLGILVVGVRGHHAPWAQAACLDMSHLPLGLCETLDLQGRLHGSQWGALLLDWPWH